MKIAIGEYKVTTRNFAWADQKRTEFHVILGNGIILVAVVDGEFTAINAELIVKAVDHAQS